MIADVDTSLAPGLFQKSVNAVKAWADIVNANGGLAGRKVVVDFCDSKLDPNATTNCVINACQNDFALVGTSANALEDLSDIDGCKNAAGKAIGIPDLAAFAFLPLACDPDTYLIGGYGPYCATAKQNPQTYRPTSATPGTTRRSSRTCTASSSTTVTCRRSRPTSSRTSRADEDLGIKADAQGSYAESGAAPQSALTPVISAIKAAGSSYVYAGSTPQNTILLEREAKLQGVSSVKVWACNSGCYDSSFYPAGRVGRERHLRAAGRPALLHRVPGQPGPGRAGQADGRHLEPQQQRHPLLRHGLLFQDAVQKATANGGTL